MGGSSKSVTIGYKYYLGMLMGLWKGPIDKILHIKVDGRIAWERPVDAGDTDPGTLPIDIAAGDLFGGEKREGGISGRVEMQMGDPTQTENAYLQSILGDDIPAFRGVYTAVLNQVYMGNNPYLKPWSFRASRIFTRQNGIEQWFPERASVWPPGELPESTELICEYDVETPILNETWVKPGMFSSENWTRNYADTVPGDDGAFFGGLFNELENGTFMATDAIIIQAGAVQFGSTDNEPYRFYMDSAPGDQKYSYQVQITRPDNGIEILFPGDFDTAALAKAAWQGKTYSITGFTEYKMWHSRTTEPDSAFHVAGGSNLTAYLVNAETECIEIFPAGPDMNPAHIIRECLTDPDWGMGYADSDIDDASFTAAAIALFDEGFGLSITWTRESPIIDFVSEILRHIDAVLYVSRDSGKFVLKLIRDDYALSDLVTLDGSNIASVSNAGRPAVGDLVSSVTVNYWDRETGETGSVTRHNQGLYQSQTGGGGSVTSAYPAITGATLAQMVCQRDLKSLSTPLLSCQVEATRIAEGLNVGDAFILNWPKLGIISVVMRVQQMTLGDSEEQTIVIDALEDVFALPDPGNTGGGQGGLWTDPVDVLPLAASPRSVGEIPYFELFGSLGGSTLNLALEENPEVGYLYASGGRQGRELNADLLVDSGSGYATVGTLDFCPTAKSADSVGFTDTQLYIDDAIDLDDIDFGTVAQINAELVVVTAIGSDSSGQYITVGRGVGDTVPTQHDADSSIVFWGSAWLGDGVQYTDGEEIDVKLTTKLGSQSLTVGAAPVDTAVMASRAIRPYPPGRLRLNGLEYPSSITGALTVTWAHRNRQTQADVLVDTTQTSVTPAINTRYTLEFYDAMDALIISREDIGLPTADVVLDYTGDVTLKLWTVDDYGESLQQHAFTFAYTPPGGPSNITATDYEPYVPTWEIDGNGA